MNEKPLSESQLKVLLTLEENDALTYEELAMESGLSYDGVRGRVSELRQRGFNIERVKEGKNTLLSFSGKLEKERDKLLRPHTYGDMISRRTRSLEDFYGITDFLNEIRKSNPKVKKKAIHLKNKCGLLMLSDIHFGSIVRDGEKKIYDTEIALSRMRELTEKVIDKIKEEKLDSIYIAVLGDIVDGDAVYRNQTYNIEKAAVEQVKDAVTAISNMIKSLINAGVKVVVGCVRGNHGVTNYKNLEQDNWDNVVYDMLNLVFTDNKNVIINHYANREAKVKILDKQVVITHGDILGNQIRTASGAQAFRGLIGKHKLFDNDLILIGHLHTFEFMVDQSKMLVRNGAMQSTSDYALSNNFYNVPEQTFMVLEEGIVYPKIFPIEFSG